MYSNITLHDEREGIFSGNDRIAETAELVEIAELAETAEIMKFFVKKPTSHIYPNTHAHITRLNTAIYHTTQRLLWS